MAGSKAKGQRRKSLRDEVRDALLTMLRDTSAPATARAHAARSLVLMLGEEGGDPEAERDASGLTIEELDEEIARIQQPKG